MVLVLSSVTLQAVAELASRGALEEDGAFEAAHPRDEQGQFAAKSAQANDQKQPPPKKKAKAKAKAKRRPSLARIRGHELEWAQRIWTEHCLSDTPYEDFYGRIGNQFGDRTGVWGDKNLRKFVFNQSNKRLTTILGPNYQLEHAEDPDVQDAVADLSLIPTPVLVALHDSGVKVAIGTRPIGTYPEFNAVGYAPDQKTWDGRALSGVGAVYIHEQKFAVVNAKATSPDTTLHELGHAFDLNVAHLSTDPAFRSIQQQEGGLLDSSYFLDPQHPDESAREFAAETLNRSWRRIPTGPLTDAYITGRHYAPRAPARKRVA